VIKRKLRSWQNLCRGINLISNITFYHFLIESFHHNVHEVLFCILNKKENKEAGSNLFGGKGSKGKKLRIISELMLDIGLEPRISLKVTTQTKHHDN
jgi:hypothetical protein